MQPCAQHSTELFKELKFFLDDEHADTELFDGLAAFRFINKCFVSRGKRRWYATGKLERSTSWFLVLGALVLACCLQHVGPDLVTDGQGGHPTTAAKLHSLQTRSPKKLCAEAPLDAALDAPRSLFFFFGILCGTRRRGQPRFEACAEELPPALF